MFVGFAFFCFSSWCRRSTAIFDCGTSWSSFIGSGNSQKLSFPLELKQLQHLWESTISARSICISNSGCKVKMKSLMSVWISLPLMQPTDVILKLVAVTSGTHSLCNPFKGQALIMPVMAHTMQGFSGYQNSHPSHFLLHLSQTSLVYSSFGRGKRIKQGATLISTLFMQLKNLLTPENSLSIEFFSNCILELKFLFCLF